MSYNSSSPMHCFLHFIDSSGGCNKKSKTSSCPVQAPFVLMLVALLDLVNNPFPRQLEIFGPNLGFE